MCRVMNNRIQSYRKQVSMKQQILAQKLGVNRTYLSKVENHVNNLSPELMIKVCTIFECDIADMFFINKSDGDI